MVRCLKGLESHICNKHNNYFCKKIYKKCCSSNQNTYSQTFIANSDDEISIIHEFLSRWGTPNTVQKYINCYTTNYVESANRVMLMFYSKAQIPKDPKTYDTAMYLMCLKLMYGWQYESVLFEKMGLEMNDVQLEELNRRIKKSATEKKYKNTQKAKTERKILRVGRLKQNKNYNQDYKNKADIKKHKQNNRGSKKTLMLNNSSNGSDKNTTTTTKTTKTTMANRSKKKHLQSRMTSTTQTNNQLSPVSKKNSNNYKTAIDLTSGSNSNDNNNNKPITIDDFEDNNNLDTREGPRNYLSMMIDGLNTMFNIK